jgi:endonuclease/exonuclease/phosphatase family metal-dependent hydrolase
VVTEPSDNTRPSLARAALTTAHVVSLAALWAVTAARWIPPLRALHRIEVLLSSASLVLPHAYGALLLVSLPLCIGRGRKARPSQVVTGLIVLSMVWLWGPGFVAWPARPRDDAISAQVLTWNVARLGEFCGRGECEEEEAEALRCVGEVLATHKPDIVALQEISLRRLEALEEALSWRCQLPGGQPAWSDYEGRGIAEHGGVAVCVPREGRWRLHSLQRPTLPPGWHYVFTEAEHIDSGALLNFLSVHFKPVRLGEEEARRLLTGELEGLRQAARSVGRATVEQEGQASQLLETTARFNDPTVIAGDFNSTRDARIHHGLREQFIDTWERGGWGQGASRVFAGVPLRIDFIYASAGHFGVLGAKQDGAGCSDHRPVISTLQLR